MERYDASCTKESSMSSQHNCPSYYFYPKYASKVKNWHPHRSFAFDLMRELKPNLVVELGVHYGDSYFTFCQARREHGLGTVCYGVDTWLGDSQSI